MSERSKNSIRGKIDELKRSVNPKAIFAITSDSVIIFASASLIKILKDDPTGSSFLPLAHPIDRQTMKEALDKVESGEFTRTMQLGQQLLSVQMTTKRETLDGRVIGLTIINKITIL
jgi:hypothetical protein